MNITSARGIGLAATALLCLSAGASAHEIKAAANQAVNAAFDIIETRVTTYHGHAIFRTRVRASAGAKKPRATGKFEGSDVYAYVWPTSLNSADAGFEKDQGIVALAVTFHPDFDDAAKGAKNRDRWHPHWVVLGEDKACPGGLKVKDIPAGTKPKLPENWPGVPLLIDSPEYKDRVEKQLASQIPGPADRGPDAFRKVLEKDSERIAALIKAIGMKPAQ